jgi:threonyl-tRNA synthetase
MIEFSIEIVNGDKSVSVKSGRTGQEIISEIQNQKIMKIPADVLGLKINSEIFDLHTPLLNPSQALKAELITPRSPEALELIRHTSAHVLAHAVKELYPEVQVTIGPVIENGFFYDFSKKVGFKEEDLPAIEERMKKIIESRLPIRRESYSINKAIEFFKKQGEFYKCEIIEDIAKNTGAQEVSLYWHGDQFVDLCRGPHLLNTGHIPAVKLMSVAGAYWRGSEKNEMLTRVYGTAFESRDSLKAYLNQIEEAKKRDHRRIGVDQGLFSFHPEAPAAPFFHPNGAFVYIQIVELLRDLNKKFGFSEVISPLIMSQELWKLSGHYDNYRENMYFTEIDERSFAVKPMNCPGHCLMYKTERHSYRELPLRLSEFGRVHRHERSGVTAGLFRVRSFVQDDAHVFCTVEQVENEIQNVLSMMKIFYRIFGFEYRMELSTRPEKSIGTDEVWNKAEGALKNALEKGGYPYKLNPGDGAFYGPKIDFHLKDSLGRTHQCGTIQLDFSMPSRFGLEYSGSDNHAHTPVMIHRAIAGSLERFLGILIEHWAGQFPTWIAPQQAVIMTVSDDAVEYGRGLYERMKNQGFRVRLDDSSEKLAAKVKRYQPMKVPYLVILGGREAENKQVSLRLSKNEQRNGVDCEQFLKELSTEGRPALE